MIASYHEVFMKYRVEAYWDTGTLKMQTGWDTGTSKMWKIWDTGTLKMQTKKLKIFENLRQRTV